VTDSEHSLRLLIQTADALLLTMNSARGERNAYLDKIIDSRVREYVAAREHVLAALAK